MNKYLEIIVYFAALFGYFLTKYTKIIKDEKLRKIYVVLSFSKLEIHKNN